jgi:hypothetical protein
MTIKEQIIIDIIKLSDSQLVEKVYSFLQNLKKEIVNKENTVQFSIPSLWFEKLKVYTVEEINLSSFSYKLPKKENIVGKWEGNETAEELINMITK